MHSDWSVTRLTIIFLLLNLLGGHITARQGLAAESARIVAAATAIPLQPDSTWRQESEDDGITVYSRSMEGSSISEVLAESTIHAPVEKVLAAISDYRNYPAFMPYVEESAILGKENGETVLFQQLGFPFPISDRFYTIMLWRAQDPLEKGAVLITWDIAREELRKKEGKGVEVTLNRGGWRLWPIANNASTRILYYIHTDPGGALPAWVSNIANTVAVPKVIKGLRDRVLTDTHETGGEAVRE